MPGMNGVELARRLGDRWPGLRLVMVTGFESPETRERAGQAGIAAFVSKSRVHSMRLSELLSAR
jgi:DNA-binding NarL/FixJ family response regulator